MRDPWLAATLVLAAALRLIGLGHGLPFVYNPDEINIMSRALSVAQDPNPHYFLYPSFLFYFLFALLGGLFVLGRIVGRYASLADFETRFFQDPTDFYLVGRALGVVSALLTIVLTYHLVHRHFGRVAARAASVFLAVAYFHVRDAHYLKHDVPVGLLIILALLIFDRALEHRSLGAYLASGVAIGLAFATHYYTIFLAPAFVLCHWISSGARNLKHLAVSALASVITFFALSPFVVLDLPVALEHMKANRQVVVDRSLDSGSMIFPSLVSYVKFLAEQGLGYLLLGLVAVGWVLMAKRGVRYLSLWGAFPLFFIGLMSYTFFAGRYLNPIAPCLAAAAGLAMSAIHRHWGKVAAAAVGILACAQPLYNDYQIVRLFRGQDTRSLARQWILENKKDGAAVALQSYSVPLPQSIENYRESLARNGALSELERRGKYFHLSEVAERANPSYRLYFMGRGEEKDRIYIDYQEVIEKRLEPLQSNGVDILVLRYPPGEWPPQFVGLIELVTHRARMQASFSPFRSADKGRHPYMDNEDWPPSRLLEHRGPRVEIWSLEGRD